MNERRRSASLSERERGLPFSKGLWASHLSVTGLTPAAAYSVANKIDERLQAQGRNTIADDELNEMTLDVLREQSGDRYAEAFIKWLSVGELNLPLIILIGGATGVGKSTIATQLATRLGITRVVGTDAVREVLRSAFTEQIFPTLYASSYMADGAVRQPIPHSGDRLIIGFREQAAAVAVGAQALIDRAIEEGTDLIIEGAHLVPGFLQGIESQKALIVSLLVTVEDEELHRSHFYRRGREANARSQEKYLAAFKKIRRIQRYMISSALMRGVPVIPHGDLDQTLTEVLDHVITQALEMSERSPDSVKNDRDLLGQAAQVIEKQKGEGSKKREAVP
jgi:2-phosphoglycerate kinase